MKVSAPISYDGKNNITIDGLSIIAGNVPSITVQNCINLRISNCNLYNGVGAGAVGIKLYKCQNVTIENCHITNVASGILASTSTGVYIANNRMLNMNGPMPRGQFVQLVSCYGPGNKIMNNKFENIMGQSVPEDAINIFQSNGTKDGPISIQYNQIRGGGPSKTGGGICLGDGGGSWQLASDNILVNPGQYGIGIASGTNMSILNNRIYGKQQPFTNVGILAWNQYPCECGEVTIDRNEVDWTAAGGYKNPFWDGGNCGVIKGANRLYATLDETILPKNLYS
jgi:hypothetical protein